MRETSLAATLFGAYRRDALALLLLHPEQALHVREIARLTRKAPGTLLRELNRLADAGILLRLPLANLVRYQANGRCPIYDDLRSILKKTVGVTDVLREALAPLAARIRVAFVYGSVARGDERAGSDLDLMVVGDVTLAEVAGALAPGAAALGREVNPNVFPPGEFAAARRAGDPFVGRVVAGAKLFVVGTSDDLGKPAAHRQGQGPRGDARGGRSPAARGNKGAGRR